METSKYAILGLFLAVFFLMFGSWGSIVWLSKNKPYALKFNIDSVTLQNINMTSDQITADWNFNISIWNANEFGWSYGLVATLYNDQTYEYRRDTVVPFYATDARIPTFSQGGNNETTFTAQFEGVSVPIDNSKKGSGRNSEFVDVPLELFLEGKIEPVPKNSLSRIIRWLASPIHVECRKVKIGISAGSTHVYLGKGSHCFSRWGSFLLN